MSTYVLIHGSWHAAWCWYKIIPRLQSASHKVIAPDMPAHGRDWRSPGPITMQDYVDTITKVLDEQDEPVVLVAHSRAGLQATLAAEARPKKIHTLVYLAGILLPNGVRLTDWPDPDSVLWPNVDFNEQEGWDMIRPEIYRNRSITTARTRTLPYRTRCSRANPVGRTALPTRSFARRRKISAACQRCISNSARTAPSLKHFNSACTRRRPVISC
jgi:pimeloyl-ACP methyl ester carboxylesterase